jgi:hypothetical protein
MPSSVRFAVEDIAAPTRGASDAGRDASDAGFDWDDGDDWDDGRGGSAFTGAGVVGAKAAGFAAAGSATAAAGLSSVFGAGASSPQPPSTSPSSLSQTGLKRSAARSASSGLRLLPELSGFSASSDVPDIVARARCSQQPKEASIRRELHANGAIGKERSAKLSGIGDETR